MVMLLVLVAAAALAACAPVESTDQETDADGPGSSADDAARFEQMGLETDTSMASVDLGLLLGGGPPKDGIPALTDPTMESVDDADADQLDDTRGILVDFDGDRRFYPFSILVWHEVVNDTVGGMPVAVTF